jgi:hypothetical protein
VHIAALAECRRLECEAKVGDPVAEGVAATEGDDDELVGGIDSDEAFLVGECGADG